ncbi:MAG: hypothetical protein NXI30_10105 [bacterium]|nr:hypothetical protein [bacterium]
MNAFGLRGPSARGRRDPRARFRRQLLVGVIVVGVGLLIQDAAKGRLADGLPPPGNAVPALEGAAR